MKRINRIHIAGPYGSGKSTLAKRISKMLKLPIYELDESKYDRKHNRERTEEEMRDMLKEAVKKKRWIIEGAWWSRASISFRNADIVVIVHPSSISLIRNHFKRALKNEKPFSFRFGMKLLRKSLLYNHPIRRSSKHLSLYSHMHEAKKGKAMIAIVRTEMDKSMLIESLKNNFKTPIHV